MNPANAFLAVFRSLTAKAYCLCASWCSPCPAPAAPGANKHRATVQSGTVRASSTCTFIYRLGSRPEIPFESLL